MDYPLIWSKNNFSIKIFCSIPNVATGILLNSKNSVFVIDPGDGILRDLTSEIGAKEILKISDMFITHGHHDHVGGVWSLLTYMRVMLKQTPLNIYYPKGCIEIKSIYSAFINVYGDSLTYKINLIEIENQNSIHQNAIQIIPFQVNHKEFLTDGSGVRQVPSLGYKFIYDETSICYGGDTAYCETLVEMAKDSDLAVIEAGADDEEDTQMHLTIDEAKAIGESAKEYFLVHVPE